MNGKLNDVPEQSEHLHTDEEEFTGLTDAEMQEFLSTVTERFCPVCGKPIQQNKRGRTKIFCSDECRFLWKHKHPRIQNWKATRTAICPVCGKSFLAVENHKTPRKYCSHACANKGRAMEKREPREQEEQKGTEEK